MPRAVAGILAYPDVLGAAQPRPAWEVFAHLVEAISPPFANLAYLNAQAAVSTTNRASHAKNAWQRVMVGGTRLFRPRREKEGVVRYGSSHAPCVH